MNEKEVMDLLNSIDDDLVDKRIDELLKQKGEAVNMDSIKEKAMNKLEKIEGKKTGIGKKAIIAAAVAAVLMVPTVYAGEISNVIKSFFNKSVVYSTVVDGDAYYLPEELKLSERFTVLNVSVSEGLLDMVIRDNQKPDDDKVKDLNVEVIPANNESVSYTVGGYMYSEQGDYFFNFWNEKEGNYNIAPFKDFKLMIDGEAYEISLAKAGGINIDENFAVGKSDITNDDTENMRAVANVAGSIVSEDDKQNIQLVASFDDPDLKLRTIGELDFDEFTHAFENVKEGGIIGSSNGSVTNPILAYDAENNSYALEPVENPIGRTKTVFQTSAKKGTNLTVKLPSIVAGYEKQMEGINIPLPKTGELDINKELDFIIQKVYVKSVKRTSEDTAVVTFELNTGADKNVFIEDMGAYSKDVIKAETLIKGNEATITMTFDKDIEEAEFTFSWPRYIIRGNWSIELPY